MSELSDERLRELICETLTINMDETENPEEYLQPEDIELLPEDHNENNIRTAETEKTLHNDFHFTEPAIHYTDEMYCELEIGASIIDTPTRIRVIDHGIYWSET